MTALNGSAHDFFPSFKTVLNKCSQRKSLEGFLLMRQWRAGKLKGDARHVESDAALSMPSAAIRAEMTGTSDRWMQRSSTLPFI
jgi:hypothetical protein